PLVIHHQSGKRHLIFFKKKPANLPGPVVLPVIHYIIIKALIIILDPDLTSGKSHLSSYLINRLDNSRSKPGNSNHHCLDLPYRLSDPQKRDAPSEINFHQFSRCIFFTVYFHFLVLIPDSQQACYWKFHFLSGKIFRFYPIMPDFFSLPLGQQSWK